MYAGSGGTAHGINRNGPGQGNNKWGGAPSTTNVRSGLINHILTNGRASVYNRNHVFFLRPMSGGVGAKSSQHYVPAGNGNGGVNSGAFGQLNDDNKPKAGTIITTPPPGGIDLHSAAMQADVNAQKIVNSVIPTGGVVMNGTTTDSTVPPTIDTITTSSGTTKSLDSCTFIVSSDCKHDTVAVYAYVKGKAKNGKHSESHAVVATVYGKAKIQYDNAGGCPHNLLTSATTSVNTQIQAAEIAVHKDKMLKNASKRHNDGSIRAHVKGTANTIKSDISSAVDATNNVVKKIEHVITHPVKSAEDALERAVAPAIHVLDKLGREIRTAALEFVHTGETDICKSAAGMIGVVVNVENRFKRLLEALHGKAAHDVDSTGAPKCKFDSGDLSINSHLTDHGTANALTKNKFACPTKPNQDKSSVIQHFAGLEAETVSALRGGIDKIGIAYRATVDKGKIIINDLLHPKEIEHKVTEAAKEAASTALAKGKEEVNKLKNEAENDGKALLDKTKEDVAKVAHAFDCQKKCAEYHVTPRWPHHEKIKKENLKTDIETAGCKRTGFCRGI